MRISHDTGTATRRREITNMATSIRLSSETERRLDSLALRTGHTKAFYLPEMIDRGLQDTEDYYLAAHVLEGVREGRKQVHASADVRKELGVDG